MNKRPGHVKVTTEVAYCSVCGRSRTLRREEHQLGTFVRTVVTCETCHRTLSSTMGVAGVEEPATTLDVAAVEVAAPAAPKAPAARTAAPKPKPKATRARTTKPK
jgi:hypothetical protein